MANLKGTKTEANLMTAFLESGQKNESLLCKQS